MKHNRIDCRAAAVAVVVIGTLWAAGATACTCGPTGTPPEEYAQFDAVFTGIALTVGQSSNPNFLELPVFVTGVWKGVSTTSVSVFTPATPGACGYTFSVSQEYIIYANVSSEPCCAGLITGLCTRDNPLYLAQQDLIALGPPGSVPAKGASWGAVKSVYE